MNINKSMANKSSSSSSSTFMRYPELPAKMIIEPVPQSANQSIEDYLHYYDSVCSANIWDDIMAAIYLPQFITDQRLRYLIDEISPEQRKSYRWLRQTLIDAGKYRPPHSNAGNSLSERYWSKISDLRSHVRDDICQFGKEIHGLAGETYQHLAKQYVTPTDRMIKNVVPGVSKTVVGVLNKVASTVAATANSNDTSPPPPPPQRTPPSQQPPPYDDICGQAQ